jgi:hypothetical protein
MIALPELPEGQLKTVELMISIFGFAAVVVTLFFGFIQYRRAEKWKRGEFIANAIKEFESNPTVRNALLMIDYGRRKINIFQTPGLTDEEGVRITRGVQWRALLPDTLKRQFEEYRDESLKITSPISHDTPTLAEAEDVGEVFTPLEAKIRDTYDVFLGYLERFASLMELRLVTAEEFDPYLRYWIDAITKNDLPERSATWRCTLLTYINFYDYSRVMGLFAAYGKDISPDGVVYKTFMEEMKKISPEKTNIDRTKLADRLYSSIKENGY